MLQSACLTLILVDETLTPQARVRSLGGGKDKNGVFRAADPGAHRFAVLRVGALSRIAHGEESAPAVKTTFGAKAAKELTPTSVPNAPDKVALARKEMAALLAKDSDLSKYAIGDKRREAAQKRWFELLNIVSG